MDRINELNTSVGELNLLTDTKIYSLHTRCLIKMTARKYFVKTGRSLLMWDVDDSNNSMGAFLGLV
jgi:hypothetical protein